VRHIGADKEICRGGPLLSGNKVFALHMRRRIKYLGCRLTGGKEEFDPATHQVR
jgi:hypothetical protein